MQNKIQDIDWALGKLKKSTRDKEWRKTVDDVFDETTLRNIQQLFNRGVFGTIENIIATGKEANLFRAKTFDGRNRAVKIYRLNTATFRKLNRYIEGDPRFRYTGNSHRDRVFKRYIFTALFLPSKVFARNRLASFPVAIIFSIVPKTPRLNNCWMFLKVVSSKTSSTVFRHSLSLVDFFSLPRAQSMS
jgi:hypothetical protein